MKASLLLAVALLILVGCGPTTKSDPQVPTQEKSTTLHAPVDETASETGPQENEASRLSFRDVTAKSGIEFTNRNGEDAQQYAILESLGGGVGIIDINGDGWDDVVLPGGGVMTRDTAIPSGLPSGVFINRSNMQFADQAQPCGLTGVYEYSHGAACADYDNDGFTDLLITGYGGLQLYHNEGDGTFSRITLSSGLTDELWSTSAAWGDISGDGQLDLYVCHYVNWSPDNHPFCAGPDDHQREVCPPRDFDGLPDVLYINKGNGVFSDASAPYGVLQAGKGLGVLIADLNNDQQCDIYVTNDTVPNVIYQNVNGAELSDTSLVSGASLSARGTPDGSMGVQLLDYNNDGNFDIWVANYEREANALYQGQGQLLFRHVSQRTSITAVGASYVGWGTLCFDGDHDGDEDVLVSNGHVIRFPKSAPLRQTPLLFENLNGDRFRNTNSPENSYLGQQHMARGSSMSDLDRDGDLDVIVSHVNEPVVVLENERDTGNYVQLRLVGVESSRDAIGAIVHFQAGDLTIVRQWIGGGSYGSTSTRILHCGLNGQSKVDSLLVSWPTGNTTRLTDIEANTCITVIESRTKTAGIPK